ncbi:MAG: integrase arm-type DNA-binding domain-containing protein [Shinella sp.]|nr:integrase arm-type DNA-binding domain-containing protein [Shinella sp.]
MALTENACKNAKPSEKPRKISDGGGLFLLVQPTGSKLWRQAYRFNGKQKLLSHGSYPAVSLQEARERREAVKALLAKDVDPSLDRRVGQTRRKMSAEVTFELVAKEWFANQKLAWTERYATRLWTRIETDIIAVIGKRPIDGIEPLEVLEAVRAIEKRGSLNMAGRVLQTCGQVFRYAVATQRVKSDPTRDLRGALRKPVAVKHRPAMKASELGGFFKALATYTGEERTVLAIRFVLHTMVRTSEARLAEWGEIDLDGDEPVWCIPAGRMKMRNEHIVPLTPQVVDILRKLKKLSGSSKYVFPAQTREGVISQNTLIYALYRMGYHSRATVHGFRGTASTLLNEQGFNRDWIEKQLAHTDRDEVRSAYNSARWLPGRRKMLAWWSDYLDMVEAGKEPKLTAVQGEAA